MHSQHTVIDDIKSFFRGGSVLKWILVINVGVMLCIWMFMLFFWFFTAQQADDGFFRNWLGVSSRMDLVLYRPWTLLTYMFTHDVTLPFHLFSNAIILYFSGKIFSMYLGERKLLPMYVLGGLAGYVFYALLLNTVPVFRDLYPVGSNLVGASASAIAILIAGAAYAPNLEIRLFGVFPVQYKWIAVFFVVLDLINIRYDNHGGHVSHLGGAIFGFLSIYYYQRGKDILEPTARFFDKVRRLFQPRPKMRVKYRNPNFQQKAQPGHQKAAPHRAKTNENFASDPNEDTHHQKKVDAILDKISQSGYDSLSKQEKEFLFKASTRK